MSKGFSELAISKIEEYGAQSISIKSRGGYIAEALELTKYIQLNDIDTEVLQGKSCSSACVMIFLAGDNRTIGSNSSLGFHRSSNPSDEYNSAWCDYMHKLADDMDNGLCSDMLATPYESQLMIQGDDIYQMTKFTHNLNSEVINPYSGLFGGSSVARWISVEY
jgi:hypothetical protein